MKQRILSLLKIIVPILIGIYLTWYFVSNSTPEEKSSFVLAFKEANYLWILLSLVVAFLSHFSRAYRWKYLLQPLGYIPKISTMYHSVMIGYIINLTVPRSGELARAAYYSKFQNASAEKVFGTIVIERIIDLLMFGLVFMIAIWLQTDPEQFNQIKSLAESNGLPNWFIYSFAGLGVISLILFLVIQKLREKMINFLRGIVEGCLTVLKLKNKLAFILHTFFIWGAYIAMFWMTALALPELNQISLNATFACFVAGAIAVGATPGGIGLYPIMVTAVLTQLYSYEGEVAKSFSMLMWAVQTIFIVVLGITSLLLIKKEKSDNLVQS